MELRRATLKDSEIIWKLQVEAFADLLDKYQDYDTSPANEGIEKTEMRLSQSFTYFYYIIVDEIIVGAIRIVDKKDGRRKRISPLFIMPEYRGRGYAQQAMAEVERIHGQDNWELDTILEEKGNCYLYEKMGYHRTGKTEAVNDKMTLVYYEKN